jgi:hypothetical protein
VKPSGVLTVKPDAQAGVAVERLVNTGRMTWDARPILEAGEPRVLSEEQRRKLREAS